MKRWLFIFLFPAIAASGQENLFEQLTRKAPNCENIAFNAAELITGLYARANYDSITLVAREWEMYCGVSEPLFRLRILLDLEQGTFTDLFYGDEAVMDLVRNYEARTQVAAEKNYRQIYEYYKISFGFIPPNSDFDILTVLWADALLDRGDLTATGRLWCLLYSNRTEDFYNKLKDENTGESVLKDAYHVEVRKARRMIDANIALVTGIALPGNDLGRVIGPKAIWGFQLGAKHMKMQYDLTIALKSGKPREVYQVLHEGAVIQTDHYLGGYIGGDLSYEIIRKRESELDLLAGVGFDGFDAVEGNSNLNIRGKSINSLNLNSGVGYRFYLKKSGYLGLQARYNVVNYKNPQGTSLHGNYVSCLLTFNIFGNIQKQAMLTSLKQN